MPIDLEKFCTHLRKNAGTHSVGKCAKWVRMALEAAGANTVGHPSLAKDWGPTLIRLGFHAIKVVKPEAFPFLKGDIMVMQPFDGGNPAGHVAGFDGESWISDFVQRDFWAGPGYRSQRPRYVVYRR